MDIWERIEKIIDENGFIIDRPAGKNHPKYQNMVYPLDYGYISDTDSQDGNCIDLWKGKAENIGVTAIGVTVDSVKNDSEIKVFYNCDDEDMEIVHEFMNCDCMSMLIIKRYANAKKYEKKTIVKDLKE